MRNRDADELIRLNPNAYMLARFIAARARYQDGFNADGLALGEAMLGDYRSYGMSEREYRTAKSQLEQYGFATFRTTNRGTIGKLKDTRLFDPLNISNDGQNDGQPTDKRRTSDGQATTNNKVKKEKKERREEDRGVNSDACDIPPDLDRPEFLEIWNDWIQDRRERKKPVTAGAARRQLKKCQGWGITKSIQIINNAIEKGWLGLIEPDGRPLVTGPNGKSNLKPDHSEGF